LSVSPERRSGVGWSFAGTAAVLLLLPATVPGCSGAPEEDRVVNDSVYVEIMTRLVLVKDSMMSINLPYWSQQSELDSLEKVIASETGVTAEDLFEFAVVAGRDPLRMGQLWEVIRQRVDSIRPPDEEESEAGQAPARGGTRRRPSGQSTDSPE
jgi:hypothetical protein